MTVHELEPKLLRQCMENERRISAEAGTQTRTETRRWMPNPAPDGRSPCLGPEPENLMVDLRLMRETSALARATRGRSLGAPANDGYPLSGKAREIYDRSCASRIGLRGS
jgi:hypothetical protein